MKTVCLGRHLDHP